MVIVRDRCLLVSFLVALLLRFGFLFSLSLTFFLLLVDWVTRCLGQLNALIKDEVVEEKTLQRRQTLTYGMNPKIRLWGHHHQPSRLRVHIAAGIIPIELPARPSV